MNLKLEPYEKGKKPLACQLIRGFWKAHNAYDEPMEEAEADLKEWTKEGHQLFFICLDEKAVGLVHLGSRGAATDWLEDLFVLPEYQGRGIGSEAIRLTEEIVKTYSESLYIEASARNIRAIELYRKLGYDCLNTITVRKDFKPEKFEILRAEKIFEQNVEVKMLRTSSQT